MLTLAIKKVETWPVGIKKNGEIKEERKDTKRQVIFTDLPLECLPKLPLHIMNLVTTEYKKQDLKRKKQESYLEQPCKGQFHYVDDCKELVIPEAIGTFLVCPVVGKELAGWG